MSISAIGQNNLELISNALGTLTVDPKKGLVYYLFPNISAFFSSHHELYSDPALVATMPPKETELMLREIQNLTNCAGIERTVIPYIGLNYSFSSCGGQYSLASPILFIPEQYLFRRQNFAPFPQENESLERNQWIFSDDEVRFFIARELSQIKDSSLLVKVAIKVAILAAIFLFYTSPVALPAAIALFIGAIGLYLFSERHIAATADLQAVDILRKRGVFDPKQVAIRALEKLRSQNMYRHDNSSLARWFILETGDNLLDMMHPFLTTRIETIQDFR